MLRWLINQTDEIMESIEYDLVQIQKKVFNFLDFLAASLMCIGLIIFTLGDSKVRHIP